ncbi:MAG: hypothetical protein JSU01_13245, partial [Bacteroidetes bacterium]|nr:hypothetical protein [Bacteroidota bacterium]
PDCGGALWEINDDVIPRYRCHTGHVYSGKLLPGNQAEDAEESVWISIRMLEERRNLLLRLSNMQGQMGAEEANDWRRRAEELETHIERLRSLLVSIGKSGAKTAGYE